MKSRTACAALSLGLVAFGGASQHDQAMQEELMEPFCYFKYPTDQLGYPESPNACIVTYDGAFLTPYGELSFYAGEPNAVRPINKRVKTLLDGYLPIIQFHFDRDGLHYEFQAYSRPTGLDPTKNLITFISCKVSNPEGTTQQAILGANFGDIASEINADPAYPNFIAQRKALKNALGTQRSTVWHAQKYMDLAEFDAKQGTVSWPPHPDGSDVLVRQANHLVFTAPSEGSEAGLPDYPSKLKEAAVEYRFSLAPKTTRDFEFKLPAVPIEAKRTDAMSEVVNADGPKLLPSTIKAWKASLAATRRFQVDDPKVMNTFRTSLVNDLIAREYNPPGQVYQRVNKIHYDYMWIRDSSFFVRTYEMLGLFPTARATLIPFLVWKDGRAISFFKPGSPQPAGARLSVQEDYWGQVLWAVGAYVRTTQDHAFLAQVYPLLGPHIQLFVDLCKKDPRGLWPVAGPYDNEAINGHYTGHSFWALLGLKYAIFMAQEFNRADDSAAWQKIHDDYAANFLGQLRALAAKSEGYIPPGMDNVTDGNDWDNASGGLYPFEVLAVDDPLAKSTLDMVRNFNYREGIITYGGNAWVAKNLRESGQKNPDGTLHHYETFYVTESNTIRGNQRAVVDDLYSILVHTGSTNSGFEFGIPAWGNRDFGDNFTPHGWFAARFISQVRDMLVREQGDDVHLTSVLAPDWVAPGKRVQVTDAPTFFGPVTFSLICRAQGATMTLSNHWRSDSPPKKLFMHTPWFVHLTRATADGKPVAVTANSIELPLDCRKLSLKWRWTAHPNLSYKEAVRLYLEKYYHPATRESGSFLFPPD